MITIRPAGPREQAACARLWARVMTELDPDDPQSEADFRRKTKGEDFWVADNDGRIVGLATLWTPERFVHYLVVDPKWRRKGIGRDLLLMAADVLGGAFELKCAPDHAEARRFYDRFGMTAAEERLDETPPYVRYRYEPR